MHCWSKFGENPSNTFQDKKAYKLSAWWSNSSSEYTAKLKGKSKGCCSPNGA